MFKFIKNVSLPVLFCFSLLVSANETNVEVNMESILEVGRENQTLSASSQDKIDQTEKKKLISKFLNNFDNSDELVEYFVKFNDNLEKKTLNSFIKSVSKS